MKTNLLKFIPAALFITLMFTEACQSNQSQEAVDSSASTQTPASQSNPPDSTDIMKTGSAAEKFLQQAALSSLAEMEMTKLAILRATMPAIKEFAAKSEKEQLKINARLKELASADNFALPATLPPAKTEHLEALSRMEGTDFDNYLINTLVENRIVDISLFRGAAQSPDTAISAFARQTLPILQQHYEQARKISKKFDQTKYKK